MMKSKYLMALVFLATLTLSALAIAEAQNYTLVIVKMYSDGENLTLSDTDSFVATCNGAVFIEDKSSEKDGVTYLAFDATQCHASSDVSISATKGNFKDNGELSVKECESDDDLCSSGTVDNVLNYAFGVLNLVAPPAPVVKRSSGGGSSAKKVVKNNTIMAAPIVASDTPTDEIASDGLIDESSSAQEAVDSSDQESGETTAPVTGGVIGVLKSGAGIIALVFIVGILIAYIYVRKKRNSYY